MIVFSRDSDECKACEHYEDCDNKRMVMCALREMPPTESMIVPAANGACAPLLQDMAVKHDYREIKIDTNTTVTVDIEDIKKQIERDFYKSMGCPWMMNGA